MNETLIALEIASTIDHYFETSGDIIQGTGEIYAGERYMPIIDNINVKFAKFLVKHKIGIYSGIEKDIERFKDDPEGCIKYCQKCIQELEGLKRNWFTSKDSDAEIDRLIKQYQKKLDELNSNKEIKDLYNRIERSVKVPPIVLSSGTYSNIGIYIYYDDVRKIYSGEMEINNCIRNLQYFATNVPKWLKQNEVSITNRAIELNPSFATVTDTTGFHLIPNSSIDISLSMDKCYLTVALADKDGNYDEYEDAFDITFTRSGKWECNISCP